MLQTETQKLFAEIRLWKLQKQMRPERQRPYGKNTAKQKKEKETDIKEQDRGGHQ